MGHHRKKNRKRKTQKQVEGQRQHDEDHRSSLWRPIQSLDQMRDRFALELQSDLSSADCFSQPAKRLMILSRFVLKPDIGHLTQRLVPEDLAEE